MKHFNYKPDAQLLKLSLVGALLAALGSSVSFNPETQTIARNESIVSGSTSLASTKCSDHPVTAAEKKACSDEVLVIASKLNGTYKAPEKKAEVKPAPAKKAVAPKVEKKAESVSDSKDKKDKKDSKTEATVAGEAGATPVENSDSEVIPSFTLSTGEKVEGAVWEKKAGKVLYEVKCEACKTTKVESLDVNNFKNIEAVKLAIKMKYQDAAAAASEDKTSDTKTAEKEKKKKDAVEDVNDKLAVSDCDSISDDNNNLADIVSCQKDELHSILADCKDKEHEQDKAGKKLSEKEKVSCTKIVKSYYSKFVKSVIQAGLSASPETNRAAHSVGLSAVTMMLGNKDIPSRFITVELAQDIDALVRQADMGLAQQRYNMVYNNWNNSISMCQLQSAAARIQATNCGSQADAQKNASIAAAAFLNNLQMAGPFSDGTVLSATASNLSNANQNQDFMAQFQTQYSNPLQTLSALFATGTSSQQANALIQQLQAGVNPSAIVLNPNGTVGVGVGVGQNGIPQGIPVQGIRGSRDDLRFGVQQIPGLPTVQNPVINVPTAQTQAGVQQPGFIPTPQQPGIVGSRSAFQ